VSDTPKWDRRQLAVRVEVKLSDALKKLSEARRLLYEAQGEMRDDQGAVIEEWEAVHDLRAKLKQLLNEVDAEARELTALVTRHRGNGG
jgi:hypothetical protein